MSEHKTCGRCKHWHSLTGKALGKCDKKEFITTRNGMKTSRLFRPYRGRTGCKSHFEPREQEG